jgi:hypothetical protein
VNAYQHLQLNPKSDDGPDAQRRLF